MYVLNSRVETSLGFPDLNSKHVLLKVVTDLIKEAASLHKRFNNEVRFSENTFIVLLTPEKFFYWTRNYFIK